MIKGLIFDFDGLILETEGPIYQSWLEVYRSYGRELPISEWVQIIGLGMDDFNPYTALEKQLNRSLEHEKIEPQRRQREHELVNIQPPLPGVTGYLEEAQRMGLKIGLASSSSCKWVTGHLERLGLLDYFDCIRGSDDVRRTKPDPELYISTVKCLGLKARQVVAFEDSQHGIASAKSAGLFCVAVPTEMTSASPLDQADLRLSSLADMPLSELIELIESKR